MDPGAITSLLLDWKTGKREALDALTPVVYDELRRLASSSMRRERQGHTLQPTALINEAYLRIVARTLPAFNDRAHFFAFSARIMRQVLVDSVRARNAAKRGDGVARVEFDDALEVASSDGRCENVLALHEALERLSAQDYRRAAVIEMRYFGGLTREEIAASLGVSLPTVKRDIALGEGWLRREMGGSAQSAR